MIIEETIKDVRAELLRAHEKYGSFHSPHEGYAVLLEETNELWTAVKQKSGSDIYHEAVQVAAMAIQIAVQSYQGIDTLLDTKVDPVIEDELQKRRDEWLKRWDEYDLSTGERRQ